MKNYVARRLHYEFPDIQVVNGNFKCTDIHQGQLGDCFLLSALAAIAEFPDRIDRIFIQNKRSPKGAYCVALCITGQFREIFIDDILLCSKEKKGNKKEIELAFAKNSQSNFFMIFRPNVGAID
jgi:calpain-15